MASRIRYEGNSEIGVFAKLTNKYALVTDGGAESFYHAIEGELAKDIPVVRCSVAGCRFVGRVTVGNSKVRVAPYLVTSGAAPLGNQSSVVTFCPQALRNARCHCALSQKAVLTH